MATRVETACARRARYYSSRDGFNITYPRIPAHVFLAERDRALDPAAPTGLVALDLSGPRSEGIPRRRTTAAGPSEGTGPLAEPAPGA